MPSSVELCLVVTTDALDAMYKDLLAGSRVTVSRPDVTLHLIINDSIKHGVSLSRREDREWPSYLIIGGEVRKTIGAPPASRSNIATSMVPTTDPGIKSED